VTAFGSPGFSKERRLEPQITLGLLTDDGTTDLGADDRRFAHDLCAERLDQLVTKNEIGGGAGERRDGVHGHVAPELVPDFILNDRGRINFESRLTKRAGNSGESRRHAPVRLAHDESSTSVAYHHAGLGSARAEVNNNAEYALGWRSSGRSSRRGR
jgi:hypothetical protein